MTFTNSVCPMPTNNDNEFVQSSLYPQQYIGLALKVQEIWIQCAPSHFPQIFFLVTLLEVSTRMHQGYKHTDFKMYMKIHPHHLLFASWNVLFKNWFAALSFLWHKTLNIVFGSDLFHLPVVGGMGSLCPEPATPIPLVSQVTMLKSSISCSVHCPINSITPSVVSPSCSTTSLAINPSPQVQKTRFKLSKSSSIISWSVR